MRVRLQRLATIHLPPLLLYLGLALLMTYPLMFNFGRAVPGDGVDSWQNIWNMWWLRQALLDGQNPFYTEMIYYPDGTSLLLHTLNPINFLITLPFQALFGLVVAYNVALIVALVISGYTAFLLARDITGDQRAALVSGVVFACSGYLLAQALGHLNLIAAQWLPLSALALRQASRTPRLTWIGLAAVCLALNALSDWQYLLFALLWASWYALALLWTRRTLRAPLPTVLAIGIALLLLLPLLLPTAQLAAATPSADTGDRYRTGSSADLVDFLLPSQLHPLWGSAATQAQRYKNDTIIHNKTAYLGIAALALAVVGLWAAIRHPDRVQHAPSAQKQPSLPLPDDSPWFWLLSALLFGVLALGPQLQVGGQLTDIPLPAALFYSLPFVNISRVPLRFLVLVMMALGVLAAFGTLALLRGFQHCSLRPNRTGALLVAMLVALITFDNLVAPFPLAEIYIPPIYAELREDGEEYAILESPAYARTSVIYMFYQAVHEKPLVGGNISREQPYPLRDQIPLVRLYTSAEPVYDIVGQDPRTIAASVFSYFNIRYLLLHSEGGALSYHMLPTVAAAASQEEPRQVTIPGRSFLVYRVTPPAAPLPFLGIGPGWSTPQRAAQGATVRQVLPGSAAELLIYSAEPHQGTLTLRLHSTNTVEGQLQIALAEVPLTTLSIAAGSADYALPLDITEGVTTLTLELSGDGVLVVERVDLE